MVLDAFPEVKQLSPAQKLAMVGELWDDLASDPANVPVSREVVEELDRRMAHFRDHPNEFTTWESIQEKVLGRKL
jgi:putative addiction module component (TIGR02574 family)